MDFELARGTERRLLDPICRTEHGDGYSVLRSERFPRFYCGNALEVTELRGRKLAELEQLFARHFSPERYEHKMLVVPDSPEGRALCAEAQTQGYSVTRNVYLIAEPSAVEPALAPGLTIRTVDSPERWELFRSFDRVLSAEHDWYDGSDMLFEKTRVISQAIGIEWHYVSPLDRDEIWAKLGIFRHGALDRLQDVETAPERRRVGLATALVSTALQISGSRGRRLVVCADEEENAIHLYRQLGFRDVGCSIDLMWYRAA